MAKDPSTGDLVNDWRKVPPTEAELNRLSELNEQLNLPEHYYPFVGALLGSSTEVQRAIRIFEKYGTPK